MKYSNDRLGAALKLYLGGNPLPMHMPGHKRNPDFISHEFTRDITEIEGFDNLHNPTGLLKDLEDAAAELYGADKAYVSVNGSTAMLLAAISSCLMTFPGTKVLAAMNCHLAVWHALEITNASVVPLMPSCDEALPFPGTVSASDIEKILARNPDIKTVIITSPTYEGVISDTEAIYRVTRKYDAVLITDSAHGAHLGLNPFWGLKSSGDLVVTSIHKTLSAPTQTALLLSSEGSPVSEEAIRHYIDVYESSSPSYVLLKGVSRCIADLTKKPCIMDVWIDGVKLAEESLSSLGGFKFWNTPVKDRSKIIILGDGISLGEHLRFDFGIECEAMYPTHLIAMTGIGDTYDSIKRFCDAVIETDKSFDAYVPGTYTARPVPQLVEPIGKSALALVKAEEVPFEESCGRISCEYIYSYPPGVPVLIPGELITQKTLDCIDSGSSSPRTVKVLP